MEDSREMLERFINDDYPEHEVQDDQILKMDNGLELQDHYFIDYQLFEIEEAIQELQDEPERTLEEISTIRPAESEFEIVYEHPVDFPEIIYEDKKAK